MITKEKLQRHIDSFPDEMSIDELIDKLVFIRKMEDRIQESLRNETIDQEQLKSDVAKWFE